ncbi:hypothetical protein AC578_5731 [Pseudocercospora eumusae]|uniref:Uncharacterized protein n=1 Tax=Pseudocercospora eumusae TaxID=321146 RepID=A0A139HEL0_9PEZI|nr:hypothetical protein AC578_5731 [Pseudocercospora eumusae]
MPENRNESGKQRVPLSELNPNITNPRRDVLHPELGPMLSLAEAQARPDIKRRGHLRPELGPMLSLSEAQARPDVKRRGFLPTEQRQTTESTQPVFPVPMPKRKPFPTNTQLDSAGGVERLSQIKKKPVSSKFSPNVPDPSQAPGEERGSPIDPSWERSPGKLWRWLEAESKGSIEAWPSYRSPPASEASVDQVWRYLEAETDGVIEAWRRDPFDG